MHSFVPLGQKLPKIRENGLTRLSRGFLDEFRQLVVDHRKQVLSYNETLEISDLEGEWRVLCDMPNSIDKYADNAIFAIEHHDQKRLQLKYIFNDLSKLRKLRTFNFLAYFFDLDSLLFTLRRNDNIKRFSIFEKSYYVPYFNGSENLFVISDLAGSQMWVLSKEKKLRRSLKRNLFIKLESLGFDLQNLRIHDS